VATPATGLPTGTVTFLFSDIEGSTRLAQRLGADGWAAALREHDRLVDRAIVAHAGRVVKHEGDGTFAVFADVADAVLAAVEMARGVAGIAADTVRAGPGPAVRIRIGLHTGTATTTEDGADYVGLEVHYAARLAAAANGGQIVLSDTAVQLLGTAGRATIEASGPGGAGFRPEGYHPLRDFETPRLVTRVVIPGVADDERPLRSERALGNLPEPVTSFVGRETELAETAALLESARLLTLSGPGGTGKTRLAIAVAGAVRRRFKDGTWFIDLAPIRDPALLHSVIATAMELPRTAEIPIAETVRDHLRDRSLVLVLDNVEQLLPAAADVVADLVRGAPDLRVIVTSREILRIAGEQEYAVPPLDGGDAVELFVERARLVRSDYELVPDGRAVVMAIVERLGGLPLAVELAAARIRLFSPERILERLDRSLDLLSAGARDLPERQRTIRGAIAWSVELLADDERALFRRLGVFSGGWTADAAQSVADPAGAEIDALTDLEGLADKSLVRIEPTDHGEPRFTRHQFVREYSLELLDTAGERATCERRHAEVYLAFAESAGTHLMAADSDHWTDLVEHEIHNLRAAMRWSLDHDEPVVGLRIAASIWRFWHQRAELREGRDWLTQLLAAPGAEADPVARVAALSAAGGLAYWANDFPAAWALYAERLALAETLGDPGILAEAHYDRGFEYVVERDPARLRIQEQRALELFEAAGDEDGAVRARQALVLGAFLGGDLDAARILETANLEGFRRSGSWYRTADSLTLLSSIDYLVGDLDAATRHVQEALGILRPRSVTAPIIGALGVMANIAIDRGRYPEAGRLAGAVAVTAARAQIANAMVQVLHMPEPVERLRQTIGSTAEPWLTEGEALELDDAIAIALDEPAGAAG